MAWLPGHPFLAGKTTEHMQSLPSIEIVKAKNGFILNVNRPRPIEMPDFQKMAATMAKELGRNMPGEEWKNRADDGELFQHVPKPAYEVLVFTTLDDALEYVETELMEEE